MKNIKLYYFIKKPNFGDMLNVDLVECLAGRKVEWASPKTCHCVCIGSLMEGMLRRKISLMSRILRFIKPKVFIWGTGFIELEKTKLLKPRRKYTVRAVRGKYTQERLGRYLRQDMKDVVLGDPGLLANRLIDTTKIKKKYKLGIIPHYVDKASSLLKNIQVENSIIIDIQQKPEIVLKQIAECENIISSAMHGLIAADSLGVPNIRMILSDKIWGGDYKFRDYYSAFDMELPQACILSAETVITDIKFIRQQYQIKPEQVEKICQNLLQVFPYKKRI